ncbi:sensor domain-containing protein [Pseudorhizobium banfieldiae]|nr:EAL domain-containing protein [Pseudorhizobium banfieldiae]CAD6601567.1 bifunctional diguanylate cyclase/phosphodiesterase [arsenite-oxidising bacterium NT-25]
MFVALRIKSEIDDEVAATGRLALAHQSQGFGTDALFHAYAEHELDRNPSVAAIAIASENGLETFLSRRTSDLTSDRDQLAAAVREQVALRASAIMSKPDSPFLIIVSPIEATDSSPVSAVLLIDKATLMAASGIDFSSVSGEARLKTAPGLEIAVGDTQAPTKTPFVGQSTISDLQPLEWHIPVGTTVWQVLLAPSTGWDVTAPDQAEYRFSLVFGGLGVMLPILLASVLIGERNRNITALKAREANLLELSQRFNLAMEASNIGIWEVTDNGHHLFWDDRSAALHGCEQDGVRNRLDDWHGAIYPEDLEAAEAHFFNCICAKTACTETYRVATEDGAVRYLRSAGASYHNPDGSLRSTGIVWDVTADMLMAQMLRDAKAVSDIKNAELELALDELSKREQELEELSSKLDLALASYNCGIWEVDLETRTERWDERMCQLYGMRYTDGIVSQHEWSKLVHPDDREMAKTVSYEFQTSGIKETLVVRVPQGERDLRYIRSVGQLQVDRNGRRKVVGIAFDVTEDAVLTAQLKAAKAESDAKNLELELAKSRIEHNALHDPLTGLGNRRKLDAELDLLSRQSRTERQKLTILHLDLDRFKQINDTLGHAAGDAMLVHASEVLSRNVRENDIVARIGGDEFVILIRDENGHDCVAQLATRIIGELRQPIDFEGFACRGGVSIGIAQASGVNIDARRVLVNADIALYRAKAMGRNRYEFFTQNLQAEIVGHKRTADELLAGLENHEFTTRYQPQFDARTSQLAGVEALVRWNHPHLGILTPDRFLRIAEELNVAATIDQIVLETVLKDLKRWADLGVSVPRVSVNVSSRRLHDEKLIEGLKLLDIRPGQIAFELVESIFLDEHEDVVARNLEQISGLGIDIEIDDFGTGHTSIVGVLKLKPQRLKIDRQLVMPILHSPQERALVRSIIDIARSLGVETVAEGVESMQHAAMLRELGCDLLQGYAFARPLSFAEFTEAAIVRWARAAA